MAFSSDILAKIAQLEAQLARKDAIISKQNAKLQSQTEQLEYLSEKNQHQAGRISILEEMVRCLKIKRYAASSEKTPLDQLSLFDEAELFTDADILRFEKDNEQAETNSKDENKPQRKKPGRKPFSPDLPRVQVFLRLTEEEKAGAKSTFFTKVKEELDVVPAKVRVLEYMQEKAVFEQTEKQGTKMITAPLPKHPVPGALGSINLITYAITTKYVDGLPLYRIEKQLDRYGGDISVATLASYIIKSAELFQPLINLLREYQQAGHIIAMDETPIQVLKEPDKPATSSKYMWVSLGGLPDKQSVLFHYAPSKAQDIPLLLLEGFKGYLQTDGNPSYNAACKKYELVSVGCMDHARRKFKEAQKSQPRGKKAQVSKADIALSLINKLYAIETKIKNLTLKGEEALVYRQQHSQPLLKKIKTFLDANVNKVPSDSLTGKAINYMLNQWEKLNVYCTNPELRISNIMAENAIRPFAVGRKAWLFAATPSGAKASATCYSLVETAKLNGLEPSNYIHTLLTLLPQASTLEDIEKLLPWNIKKD